MSHTPLPSWNDGPTKRAILDFVSAVTTPGAAYVPPLERIATFDNDGTLSVERPLPAQFDFIFGKWTAQVQADPSLADTEPYKSLLAHNTDFFAGLSRQDPQLLALLESNLGQTWKGATPQEFDDEVRQWAAHQRHPRFDRPAVELVYQPMLELFDHLRDHEFRVYVCSGGGRDFMRVSAEEIWGINREDVIGSAPDVAFVDGRIVRTEHLYGPLALGPGKPAHIFARTGRLPLIAGGNGDIDEQMLASAQFALLINHDDSEREYAYTTGAEGILAHAPAQGWTVVSMKDDWNRILD